MNKLLKYVFPLLLAVNQVMSHLIMNKSGDFTDRDISKSDAQTLTVSNKDVQVKEIILDFFDEGFQVIKPSADDDRVCLVYFHEKEADASTCFIRVLVPDDSNDQNEKLKNELCEGRPVYILNPVDCSSIGFGNEGQSHVIRKRQGCTMKVEKVKTCMESVTNCVRRGIFGRCRRYNTECTRYEEKEIVTHC